jgi:hypothetical protein
MQETTEAALQPLNRLVGSWSTEATHPARPGVVVHGTASIELLETQHFLIVRSRNDHPDFPDAISILGFTDVDRVGRTPTNRTPAVALRQLQRENS